MCPIMNIIIIMSGDTHRVCVDCWESTVLGGGELLAAGPQRAQTCTAHIPPPARPLPHSLIPANAAMKYGSEREAEAVADYARLVPQHRREEEVGFVTQRSAAQQQRQTRQMCIDRN